MKVYGPKRGEMQVPGWQPSGEYLPNPYYMDLAIRYGSRCVERGQHPVGAVVTRVAEMFNTDTEQLEKFEFVAGVGVNEVENDSSLHAEKIAIEKAEMYHGRRKLHSLKSVLYTTHEPCPMCAGVVANSKLHGVVFGTSARDAAELAGSGDIKWRSNRVSGLDVIRGRVEAGMPEQFIIGGFRREQCLELLKTAGQLALVSSRSESA